MTHPNRFELNWDGVSLTIRASLQEAVEVDRLIRAIEANRWLLAPENIEDRGRGTLPADVAEAGPSVASTPTAPAVALAVEPKPRAIAPSSEIVASLWPTGQTPKQIAAAAGVTESRVYQIAKKLDLPRRQVQAKAPPAVDAEELARRSENRRIIAEMRPTEATREEIAARVGLSTWSVTRIGREELGLPKRHSGPKFTDAPPTPAAAADGKTSPVPDVGPATAVTDPEPAAGRFDMTNDDRPPIETPPTNGHAASLDGIILDVAGETIAFDGRSMDLSKSQTRMLSVLIGAAGAPVGVPTIMKRVYGTIAKSEAEHLLAVACKDLRNGLPGIGLELRTTPGVGMAIAVKEAVAA